MAATLPSNSIHHKHLQNMRKSTILIPEESKSKGSRKRHWNRCYCVIEEHSFPWLGILLHVSTIIYNSIFWNFTLYKQHCIIYKRFYSLGIAREDLCWMHQHWMRTVFRTYCSTDRWRRDREGWSPGIALDGHSWGFSSRWRTRKLIIKPSLFITNTGQTNL